MKEIEIRISPDGEIKAEAFGFKGGTCEKLIRDILVRAGAQEIDGDKKPEYYQTTSSTVTTRA